MPNLPNLIQYIIAHLSRPKLYLLFLKLVTEARAFNVTLYRYTLNKNHLLTLLSWIVFLYITFLFGLHICTAFHIFNKICYSFAKNKEFINSPITNSEFRKIYHKPIINYEQNFETGPILAKTKIL